MTNKFDLIVLSPHPDDAALSCSGFIIEEQNQGKSILLTTVFAGIPTQPYPKVANEFHKRWGVTENPVEIRREEDIQGAQVLGTELLQLDYLDCIYRRDEASEDLLKSRDDIFNPLVSSELTLISQISSDLKQNCQGKLVVPIGVGKHRDHLVLRRAAEESGLEIFAYYGEYPYWAREDRDQTINEPVGFKNSELLLSEESVKIKQEAINCYKHPIRSLFDSDKIEESTKPYAALINKELYWTRE